MRIIKNKSKKTIQIKIEDTDNYEVTDDNGVNFWPTKDQVKRIAKAAYSLDNMVLLP